MTASSASHSDGPDPRGLNLPAPSGRPLRIACIGECMIELSDLAAADGRVRMGFAGDTYNTCVYLARLMGAGTGAVEVSYVTALGDDGLSERMIGAMQAEGLSSAHVARLPGRLPGLYAIELEEGGERRFHYWRAQSAARDMFGSGGLSMEALGDFDVIYLSGITLAILPEPAREDLADACAAARRRGALTVFDSNYRPALWPGADAARAAFERAWRATALGLPSRDDEATLHPGETPEDVFARLAAAGVAEVALKDGPDGPRLHAGGETVDLPRMAPAEHVADTTAAGDSFNAAYLAARLNGAPAAEAAAAGHRLARHVVSHHGAIVALPEMP